MNRCGFGLRLLCLIATVSWSGRLAAHPGHEHGDDAATPSLRRWIDTETGQEWRASYVTSHAGEVQLRTADGELVRLALDRLTTLDRNWVKRRELEIHVVNHQPQQPLAMAQVAPESVQAKDRLAAIDAAFAPFVKRKAITVRSDRDYFYVESNGMPEHGMMIGITAWQQQVPLPQKYTGDNAWQIPLHPRPAATPALAHNRFLRGAIALAVNGVPIFNPLNNRGDDAYLFGELDEWGGHCGRADDYHYHISPVHLEAIVGKGKPVAYALDGYPIYGYDEPDGSKVAGLDKLHGHKDAAGNYHYHSSKKYPYLNAGFYGEVVERDGQVDPQPRAQPMREFLPPLQGAKIVDFKETKSGSYLLTYDVKGQTGTVGYTVNNDGSAAFKFTDTAGKTESETYTPRRRPPGGGKQDAKGPPPRKNDKGKGPPRKG
ncbi:MAG: YHYH protein, partial [Planctomycetaceae bacterium]|nr:YHYH protein [Planctomycetaceae bacterium]